MSAARHRRAADRTVPKRSACLFVLVIVTAVVICACTPREDEARTTLPTRQTTIDPVNQKLDAAQQETEKRRAEIERASK